MNNLNFIKNITLAIIIAVSIPLTLFIYTNYFFPHKFYIDSQEIQQLDSELKILKNNYKLDLISFENGHVNRNEITETQNKINNLENKIEIQKNQVFENNSQSNNKRSLIIYIISIISAFALLLSNFFILNDTLKIGFNLASFFLILISYSFSENINQILMLITFTIWIIALVLLILKNK